MVMVMLDGTLDLLLGLGTFLHDMTSQKIKEKGKRRLPAGYDGNLPSR